MSFAKKKNKSSLITAISLISSQSPFCALLSNDTIILTLSFYPVAIAAVAAAAIRKGSDLFDAPFRKSNCRLSVCFPGGYFSPFSFLW